MSSGDIRDWQITASSSLPTAWDVDCHEKNARLYSANGKAWCAKHRTDSEWLQIDLGVAAKVYTYIYKYSVLKIILRLCCHDCIVADHRADHAGPSGQTRVGQRLHGLVQHGRAPLAVRDGQVRRPAGVQRQPRRSLHQAQLPGPVAGRSLRQSARRPVAQASEHAPRDRRLPGVQAAAGRATLWPHARLQHNARAQQADVSTQRWLSRQQQGLVSTPQATYVTSCLYLFLKIVQAKVLHFYFIYFEI